jgi:hypothetical protein
MLTFHLRNLDGTPAEKPMVKRSEPDWHVGDKVLIRPGTEYRIVAMEEPPDDVYGVWIVEPVPNGHQPGGRSHRRFKLGRAIRKRDGVQSASRGPVYSLRLVEQNDVVHLKDVKKDTCSHREDVFLRSGSKRPRPHERRLAVEIVGVILANSVPHLFAVQFEQHVLPHLASIEKQDRRLIGIRIRSLERDGNRVDPHSRDLSSDDDEVGIHCRAPS